MNLAQISTEWAAPIAQFGIAGSVLVWFATRVESRMKSMELSIDRMAKAALLQILSYEHNSMTIKNQAKEMLRELDLKETARQQKIQ